MVDLHTHTIHSDGRQTVSQVLKRAEAQKLKYLSITDHNSVGAYAELKNPKIRNLFSGKIITGTEVEFMRGDVMNEMLGYGIDPDKISGSELFSPEAKLAKEMDYLAKLHSTFINLGFSLRGLDEMKRDLANAESKVSRFIIHKDTSAEKNAEARKSLGLVDDATSKNFWLNEIFQPSGKYHVPVKMADMKTVSDTIRDAGGLAFMAHIFRVPHKPKELLDYATQNKLIDGVEVYYHDTINGFTVEQIAFLEGYCKKHNLLMSGGSDNHGRYYEPNLAMIEKSKVNGLLQKDLKTL